MKAEYGDDGSWGALHTKALTKGQWVPQEQGTEITGEFGAGLQISVMFRVSWRRLYGPNRVYIPLSGPGHGREAKGRK